MAVDAALSRSSAEDTVAAGHLGRISENQLHHDVSRKRITLQPKFEKTDIDQCADNGAKGQYWKGSATHMLSTRLC